MAPKQSGGRRPIIPLPSSVDAGIRRAFDTVAQLFAGTESETTTTIKRVLVTLGVAQETPSGAIIAGDGVVPSMKVPPKPTGLVATPAFRAVVLRCDTDYPFYRNHGIMEVWRAESDDQETAVAVNSTPGFLVADVPPDTTPGTIYYYWVRFVSAAGVAGPFNAIAGTVGQCSVDPSYLLTLLEGEILASHLATTLSERIDLIDAEGGLVDIAVDQGFAIEGLLGQYTVKIDNNGFVAGFGLASTAANGAGLSELYALVDRFAIINPNVAPQTITITRSGDTATATAIAHGFAVDDFIVIVGALQPEYNGTQKILTVPSADTFTFAVSGTPTTPATIDTANGYAAIKAGGARVPFIVQDGVTYLDVAMIKYAEIETLHLAGNAVTIPISVDIADTAIAGMDSWNTIYTTASLDFFGQPIACLFSFGFLSYGPLDPYAVAVEARIVRNSDSAATLLGVCGSDGMLWDGGSFYGRAQYGRSFAKNVSGLNGATTYSLQVRMMQYPYTGDANGGSLRNINLTMIGCKR